MDVRFFNGGFCRQVLGFVDRRSWWFVRFQAVFLAVEHPTRGWMLIDTGYSDRFFAATREWPWRLYAWATPARSAGNTRDQLRAAGVEPDSVRHIVVTHLHADHVGGLRDFPHAQFHLMAGAWSSLRVMAPREQLRRAFLPHLLPEDFERRAHQIPLTEFRPHPRWKFPVCDLWGDGTVQLVALPGHALGHCGVLLRDDGEEWLYASDAFWHFRQIEDAVDPLWPATKFFEDALAYRSTIATLRAANRDGLRMLACHCPGTQEYVTPAG